LRLVVDLEAAGAATDPSQGIVFGALAVLCDAAILIDRRFRCRPSRR
jgi:hypothetical protein